MASKNPADRKVCTSCGRDLISKHNFYTSPSIWYKNDGKLPFCKDCLKSNVDEKDLNSVIQMLRMIDKPYIHTLWAESVKSSKETIGIYIGKLSMKQYTNLRFKDSIYEDGSGEIGSEYVKSDDSEDSEDIVNINEVETVHGIIKVDKDLKLKWGNYSNREIIEMEKLYLDMFYANEVSTPQHKLQLKSYCKTAVLMDSALEQGDMSKYDKMAKHFDNLDKSTGFRPVDRKDSSSSSGIRSFSQIYEEIERDGFIKPNDYTEDQDIVDRTIQYMINYQMKLMNREKLSKPPEDTPKLESLNSGGEDDEES